MIYLTNGNIPLNEAYNDEIVQEANSTYQLSFRFPTSDSKWELLKEETFLIADDLDGEQDFYIFEVEKQQGYIQVYANQVFSLLNNYIISSIELDRTSGTRAVSAFSGSITRKNPFSFFSDVESEHTFNEKDKNAMEVFAKDKHSILGLWGGDLVRNGYNIRLLKNGGSENESLFMYKKNLSSYKHKTSTKSLKTRITFKTTVKGEGKDAVDRSYSVVIDSPLVNSYSQIYEAVVEVSDQDVKDEASLIAYGKQYYRTNMCDLMEDSIEISVVGKSDVNVHMFDVVSIFHETYNLDVRKKITKYTYSPMAKKLRSIGFGTFQSSLANAIGGIVNDAVRDEAKNLHTIFEEQLKKEIENSDKAFDAEFSKRQKTLEDSIEAAKAKAEEVNQELRNEVNQAFSGFSESISNSVQTLTDQYLEKANANSLLIQEAQKTSERITNTLNEFKSDSEKSKENLQHEIDDFKSKYGDKFIEFKQTADGIATKIASIESYINGDNKRQEALKRYVRDENASQTTAIREQLSNDYVAKLTYREDVNGIEQRLQSSLANKSGEIDTKLARYTQSVDGRFTDIANQLSGKVNQTDFQRVKETSQLYERIIGNSESTIADKVARMAMTNQLFQVEVAKNASNGQNLLKGTKDFSGDWKNKSANWKKHAEKYKGVDVLVKKDSWNGVGQEIDVRVGEIYTFSLWMRSDWENDTVIFYVNRNGSVGNGLGVPSGKNVAITNEWKRYSFTFNITASGFIFPRIERLNSNTNLYVAGFKLEKGSYATPYVEAPEDTVEVIRTIQNQLADSWAVQNLTSAGSVVSQINATNNQILIEAEKIRLKGKTLADEIIANDAKFKRLLVGEGNFATLNTEVLGANSITGDKLQIDEALIRKLTASDAFIESIASKRIFTTKIESVVSKSTFLEAYQGRIGGFTLGRFDNGGGRWISGVNQFAVGMGNGAGYGTRTAFWANWGNNWNQAGPNSWHVDTDGQMYCKNKATFYNGVDFSSTSFVSFYGRVEFNKRVEFLNGIDMGNSEIIGQGGSPRQGGQNAVVWWNQVGDGTVKYWGDKASDRRLKENITSTSVQALDKINKLNFVAFDFIESKKYEEIGLIAQEAEAVIPQVISRDPDNPDGYLHIDYTAFVPYLLKAVQELNQKIEKMEKTIA